MEARQFDLAAHRVHDEDLIDINVAATGFDFFDADRIAVGFELHIVEDTHRRHDKAHVACHLAAQRFDLVGELLMLFAVDEREQHVADFEAQLVHLERGADRLFGGGHGGGFGDNREFCCFDLFACRLL